MKPTIIRTNWTDGKGQLLFFSEQENLNHGPPRCFKPNGEELTGTPASNLLKHHVTGAIERGEGEAIVEIKPRVFTVVSVSSNVNSFGYKGVRLITEDGTGFECLFQAYGSDPVPVRGDKIPEKYLPTDCRRELPKAKPENAVKVIAGLA